MKIYAISDLHISTNTNKPMDVFGGNWVGYLDKIFEDWQQKVTDDDLVLIGGDISWAMNMEDAQKDLQTLSHLKGKKIIIVKFYFSNLFDLTQYTPDITILTYTHY